MTVDSMPTLATSRTEAAVTADHEISSSSSDTIADARELAEGIHRSADILLDQLLSHLSHLPELPASAATTTATTATEEDDLEKEDGGGNPLGNDKTGDTNDEEALMLKRGVTLPVFAVSWLSGQLYTLDRLQQQQQQQQQQKSGLASDCEIKRDEEDETGSHHGNTYDIEPWLGTEAAISLQYRLNLLRFLLPRAQLIRLTRKSWPPQLSSKGGASFLCSASSSKQRLKQWWRKRQIQRRSSPIQDNGDGGGNDNTIENPTETIASEFLRYARRFEHGASKCVNLWRVFPNATVLILESVPPSWIDTKGGGAELTASTRSQKQLGLRLISVANAAIYDLKDFLPPLSVLPSTAISAMPSSLQSSSSHSLMHLKLDNCSLGELTTGFASSLAQLVHLEYLSLRHNQFRSAKTLLRGLRPLTRLQYLDASANRLVGCFGPFANLCLGGQVRTLKLSENLLKTCQNSGLEKCYALRELWLDSNRIEDVIEVSGLARLPDLQCLALQRNPFSTRTMTMTMTTSHAKTNSSPSPAPSVTNNKETTEIINHNKSGQDNAFYDPNWKIRLWTWFQHERQAMTPLELPVLNKKTKNMGLDHNGCDAATIGRMTREEWDRIQEESYSIAKITTATTSTTTSSLNTALGRTRTLTTEEELPRMEELSQATMTTPIACAPSHETSSPTLTTDALALRSSLLAPVRNHRVTKKAKTRQAKIHTTDNQSKINDVAASINTIRNNKTNRGRRRRQRKSTKPSSQFLADENSHAHHKDASGDGKESSLKLSLTGGNEHNAGSKAIVRYSRDKKTPMNYSETKKQQLSFSLQDVLVSLQHEHLQQLKAPNIESETLADSLDEKEKEADLDKQNKDSSSKEVECEFPSSSSKINSVDPVAVTGKVATIKSAADYDAPNNPFLDDEVPKDEVAPKSDTEKPGENPNVQNCEEDAKIVEAVGDDEAKESRSPKPAPLETEEGRINITHVPKEEKEKCDESDDIQQSRTTDEALNTESAFSSSRCSPKRSPRRSPQRSPQRPAVINEDRIFVKPKVSSMKLKRMGNYKPFDALNSDWEDVVKKASEGRIPNGVLKSPVGQSSNYSTMNADVFSDNAANLLANITNESTDPLVAKAADQASSSRSTSDPTLDPSISSNNRLANTLPEHIWQDDNSVLSSLGASRDDIFPGVVNKFQLAEENCSYDGPDSSRGLKVVENLQLYFETFIFQTSIPDIPVDILEEMEEDHDTWQFITMYYPRIQLWPDDRRLLELERVRVSSTMNSADWTTNRERFLRVWREDIIPCGKPALRRLPPNRRNRLGFHGDKLFENADVDAYAECRKVLLCLSSKAFYILPEKDDVTMTHQQQAKKRRFPLPLDRGDRFRDAPWPHAVARHCLGELEAICIGFEFQRLTLRFRNQSFPRSDPFVYVLLTGDKRASVRIFQEIQKLAKDLIENNAISNLGTSSSANGNNSSTIAIENDSHIVLDSLNSLIESTDSSGHQEQTIGTIMHFQIVQQQWKNGDRGTVRRVCVVTDTKILLLDEDYAADGHDLSSVTVKGKHMADARYRLVDQAALPLVAQVQAAGNDPRAITIIIKPSTLSRTHRWRLICRDREGAERLVEDARKALENI